MSNNIHVKLQFESEFRRFIVQNNTKFVELKEKVATILGLKEDFSIRYLDEEKEWISISSDLELETGILLSEKLLRLEVVVHSNDFNDNQIDDEGDASGDEDGDERKCRKKKWREMRRAYFGKGECPYKGEKKFEGCPWKSRKFGERGCPMRGRRSFEEGGCPMRGRRSFEEGGCPWKLRKFGGGCPMRGRSFEEGGCPMRGRNFEGGCPMRGRRSFEEGGCPWKLRKRMLEGSCPWKRRSFEEGGCPMRGRRNFEEGGCPWKRGSWKRGFEGGCPWKMRRFEEGGCPMRGRRNFEGGCPWKMRRFFEGGCPMRGRRSFEEGGCPWKRGRHFEGRHHRRGFSSDCKERRCHWKGMDKSCKSERKCHWKGEKDDECKEKKDCHWKEDKNDDCKEENDFKEKKCHWKKERKFGKKGHWKGEKHFKNDKSSDSQEENISPEDATKELASLTEELKLLIEKKNAVKTALHENKEKITAARRSSEVDTQSIITLRNEAVAKRVEMRTLKLQIRNSKDRISQLQDFAQPKPETQ